MATRLGVAPSIADQAQNSDRIAERVIGQRDFTAKAMKLDLVDLAAQHPDVLRRLGLDPSLAKQVGRLTKPDIASRLAFSFQLPKETPPSVRVDRVAVGSDGIHATLSARDLAARGSTTALPPPHADDGGTRLSMMG